MVSIGDRDERLDLEIKLFKEFLNREYVHPSVYSTSPCSTPGIQLRDHFAGLAMKGILSNASVYCSSDDLVEDAYLIADKMMAARNKGRK